MGQVVPQRQAGQVGLSGSDMTGGTVMTERQLSRMRQVVQVE
jgi:hypothetical protein